MIKKTLFVGGGIAVVLGLLLGSNAVSYVRTTAGWVQDAVDQNVPVEFKLEHARKMIDRLEPEIRRNRHRIAMEEVQIERLEKEIDRLETRLADRRSGIEKLRDHLSSGEEYFHLKNRTYTVSQVSHELANRFKRFKTVEDTVDNYHKILGARRKGLDAAREQLDEMLTQRRSLMVDVENLQARYKMNQVAHTVSEFNFDDSQLSRTKELIASIDAQIRVDEKLADSEFDLSEEIPLDGAETTDLLDEIAEHFGESHPDASTLAEVR